MILSGEISMGMSGDYKVAIEEGTTIIRLGNYYIWWSILIVYNLLYMGKLSVKYLGLRSEEPLIVSSSRLTSNLAHLKEAEEFGARLVVLKSTNRSITISIQFPIPPVILEADDYISNYMRSNTVDEYLDLIRSAKESLSIPVIPSINCYSSGGWTGFAKNIARAGADALEINVFFLPVDRKKSAAESEKYTLNL